MRYDNLEGPPNPDADLFCAAELCMWCVRFRRSCLPKKPKVYNMMFFEKGEDVFSYCPKHGEKIITLPPRLRARQLRIAFWMPMFDTQGAKNYSLPGRNHQSIIHGGEIRGTTSVDFLTIVFLLTALRQPCSRRLL